jgi:hypothetical protein
MTIDSEEGSGCWFFLRKLDAKGTERPTFCRGPSQMIIFAFPGQIAIVAGSQIRCAVESGFTFVFKMQSVAVAFSRPFLLSAGRVLPETNTPSNVDLPNVWGPA